MKEILLTEKEMVFLVLLYYYDFLFIQLRYSSHEVWWNG